jgi:hypothetical protein
MGHPKDKIATSLAPTIQASGKVMETVNALD